MTAPRRRNRSWPAPMQPAGAAAVADWLAAMAAAAIASGAVACRRSAVQRCGRSIRHRDGQRESRPRWRSSPSWRPAALRRRDRSKNAVAEVSPDDDFAVDFAVSDFELPDFAWEGGGASVLASHCAVKAVRRWRPDCWNCCWLTGRRARRSAIRCCSRRAERCRSGIAEAGCGGGAAAELLASVAVLLSTSARKYRCPGWSRTAQPSAARSEKTRWSLLLT